MMEVDDGIAVGKKGAKPDLFFKQRVKHFIQ